MKANFVPFRIVPSILSAVLLIVFVLTVLIAGYHPVTAAPVEAANMPGLGTAVTPTQTFTLQTDTGQFANSPVAIAAPNACVPPIVQTGSIITGTSPTFMGRLIRNGVPSLCGADYTCSGVQSTGTEFSYQPFNFINPSSNWQCVQVTIDSRSCGQQVYSAAYLNSFDSADLCGNIQGAMGFSTSGVYGYSLMVPPNTNFTIVNNTTGIVPPSSNCANYTMTTSLCTTNIGVDVTKRPLSPQTIANSLDHAVVPVEVEFHNSGDFTAAVNANTITETVSVSVQDGIPAATQATFGHAGAIIPPGATITQPIVLDFTGSQFTCLPRTFEVTSQLTMNAGVYQCNGFNPPSAYISTGSVLPADNFDEDSVAFHSLPGTTITATVDTVSAATAFDIEACISGTPNGPCLPGLAGDDNFSCTFPPPSFACPRFGGQLPADPDGDNTYYLRINSGSGSGNFAGPTGDYRATILVTAGPTGACPLIPVLDNGVNSFLFANDSLSSIAGAVPIPVTVVNATVEPITIFVPPSNPSAPGCAQVYLPFLSKP